MQLQERSLPALRCVRRVRYSETIGDLKDRAARALDIPKDNIQLFWHKKEVTAAYDNRCGELPLHHVHSLPACYVLQ